MRTDSVSSSKKSSPDFSERLPVRLSVLCCISAFMLFFSASICRGENQADAGLVTSASGKVLYTDENKKDVFSDISVLMKIRQGDIIKISENAEAVFLFQINGRREAWKGPVTVRITESGGVASENPGNRQPAVSNLPVDISDTVLTASSSESASGKTRAGIRVVRGFGEEKTQANENEGVAMYEKMKKDLGENDIAPEIYIVDYYRANGSLNDMKRHTGIIKTRWGNNPGVLKWCSDIEKQN